MYYCVKNLLIDIFFRWRSHYVIPKHSGKSKCSHTKYMLSSKRRLRTPKGGYTAAAQGDHHYDVRTLEADKPAVVSSVPLNWMFLPACDADVNSRLGDARCEWPILFKFILACFLCSFLCIKFAVNTFLFEVM